MNMLAWVRVESYAVDLCWTQTGMGLPFDGFDDDDRV